MKKRLVSIAAALLFVTPGAAFAQNIDGWNFPEPSDNPARQCFGMTLRTDRAFAFQAPSPDGSDDGMLAFFGPESLKSNPGDPVLTLSVPGKLAGDNVGVVDQHEGSTAYAWRLDSFGDLDTLPDKFHVTIRVGKLKVFDGDITNFKAARATVKKCAADRDAG